MLNIYVEIRKEYKARNVIRLRKGRLRTRKWMVKEVGNPANHFGIYLNVARSLCQDIVVWRSVHYVYPWKTALWLASAKYWFKKIKDIKHSDEMGRRKVGRIILSLSERGAIQVCLRISDSQRNTRLSRLSKFVFFFKKTLSFSLTFKRRFLNYAYNNI